MPDKKDPPDLFVDYGSDKSTVIDLSKPIDWEETINEMMVNTGAICCVCHKSSKFTTYKEESIQIGDHIFKDWAIDRGYCVEHVPNRRSK
jgi:hypothetical protein